MTNVRCSRLLLQRTHEQARFLFCLSTLTFSPTIYLKHTVEMYTVVQKEWQSATSFFSHFCCSDCTLLKNNVLATCVQNRTVRTAFNDAHAGDLSVV